MSKPTDDDLNRAMAEALGYRWYIFMRCDATSGPQGRPYRALAKPGEFDDLTQEARGDEPILDLRNVPFYYQDRNTLPKILALLDYNQERRFLSWLCVCRALEDTSVRRQYSVAEVCYLMATPMCDVVEAALRALEKWPAGWDVTE